MKRFQKAVVSCVNEAVMAARDFAERVGEGSPDLRVNTYPIAQAFGRKHVEDDHLPSFAERAVQEFGGKMDYITATERFPGWLEREIHLYVPFFRRDLAPWTVRP